MKMGLWEKGMGEKPTKADPAKKKAVLASMASVKNKQAPIATDSDPGDSFDKGWNMKKSW